MGRFKVYIKPFDEFGEYVSDWTNVTEDVDMAGISSIKQSLDNTEYDVGIFKNNSLTLTLINNTGLYSDVGGSNTIFKTRRSNSLVRVDWEIMHRNTDCGFFNCGEIYLSEDVTLFEGLLSDDAIKQNASDQNLQFQVLGKERIFSEAKVQIASHTIGDSFETIILNMLQQTSITDLLTVSAANIDCGVNSTADAVAFLENKTIAEGLKEVLLYSNSVLYILNDTIYVKPRDASADLMYTFYGQGVIYAMENIIDLIDYRSGQNRTFNFWTWADTTNVSQDATSVSVYGIRKKEITTALITNSGKRDTILASLKNEFANPKIEFILRAPMNYDTIALNLLDKVSVDYPNIGLVESGNLALWDSAVWDVDKFPIEILPITIDAATRFKILSKDIDTANQEVVFYLREV